jgi:hypothetical protein
MVCNESRKTDAHVSFPIGYKANLRNLAASNKQTGKEARQRAEEARLRGEVRQSLQSSHVSETASPIQRFSRCRVMDRLIYDNQFDGWSSKTVAIEDLCKARH